MAGKRQLRGTVVSNKGDKTVIVSVERSISHPIYRKKYRVTTRFAAHDPENSGEVGQTVTIEETRPMSATKRFIVVKEPA